MEYREAELTNLALGFIDLAGEYHSGLDFGRLSTYTVKNRYQALFGVSPRHCALIWSFLCHREPSVDGIHLLWALNVLKTDPTERVLATRWRADEKTIRNGYILYWMVSLLFLL